MKKNLILFVAAFICALGASAETWKKVNLAQTDWSGKYLIVDEASNLLFKGSMTENTGLTGSSNAAQVTIADGTITTEDASNSFTIAKCGEGWSIQSASGEYINNDTPLNAMSTSDEPTACSIAFADGYPTITATGGCKLQSNGSRFRFYANEQKPVSLYKLDESSVVSYDVNVNIYDDVIYITPSSKLTTYIYFILTEADYLTHFENGRTLASQIFDVEVKLFNDPTKVLSGETQLKISELPLAQGNYYLVAAPVKATDNGSFIEYTRLADYEAASGTFTNIPFVGCKWQKPASAPTSWAGEYLLVLEGTEAAFNGSLSTTTSPRIDGFGNYKAIDMEGNEVITDDKTMAFTIEAIEGGYALKNRAGEYLGAYADKNGIQASTSPLLIQIAADGTITSEGMALSLANGKVMFRSTEGEPVVLYALTLDAEEQKPDYSQATIALDLNGTAKTLTLTPSMEGAPYAYVMITETEYQAHMEQGRSANDIFALESKLLTDDQVHTAAYTLDLSSLEKGQYYFYAATVSGIDYGTFTQYNRLGEATSVGYNTEFTGCRWEKVTGTFDWNGKYMLVAEKAGVAFNGELSGDANTGALCSTGNYITLTSHTSTSLTTETKAAAFTIAPAMGGNTVKSASGYYIGSKDGLNGIVASESEVVLNINTLGVIRDASCEYTLSYKDGKFSFRNAEALDGAELVSLYMLTQDSEEQDPIVENPTVEITFIDGQLTFTPSAEEFEYAFIARSATEHQYDLDNEFDDDDVFEIQSALIEQSHKGTFSINANTISKAGGYYYIIAAAVTGEDMGTWTLYSRAGKATGLGIYIAVVDGIATISRDGKTIATKRLENGQIIITTEAGSYNVQGQLR